MNHKSALRKSMTEKKTCLTDDKRNILDTRLYNNIINSTQYKESKCIFVFVSYNKEVDTHTIIKKALADGKIVCVPKVISKEEGMIAIRLKSFEDLKPGAYGIPEPKDMNLKVEEKDIDVCYLPGLAFDSKGGRLGYGGGFYDRFLKLLREDCKKIGICYDFQIIDEVPMDINDIYIDGIITS